MVTINTFQLPNPTVNKNPGNKAAHVEAHGSLGQPKPVAGSDLTKASEVEGLNGGKVKQIMIGSALDSFELLLNEGTQLATNTNINPMLERRSSELESLELVRRQQGSDDDLSKILNPVLNELVVTDTTSLTNTIDPRVNQTSSQGSDELSEIATNGAENVQNALPDENGGPVPVRDATESLVPSRRDLGAEAKQVGPESRIELFQEQVITPEASVLEPHDPSTSDQQTLVEFSARAEPRTTGQTEVIAELSAATISPTSSRSSVAGTLSSRPMITNGNVVSQQVIEPVVRELTQSSEGSKRLTIYLHPAELGRLTVQVGWESEIVSATIITSELATSELLNRDRNWLINNLGANGLDLSSFDVSYGGSDVDREFDEQFEQASRSRLSSSTTQTESMDKPTQQTTTADEIGDRGTVVNIIV